MAIDGKQDKKKSPVSSSMLGPGFRFHPTDEELVQYYLRRKMCGKVFRFDAISEIDVYKAEPWDLPHMSKLKTRDLEWYFFSVLDKKYGNGARTNRATDKGYWKTTGKDRAVFHKTQVVGMKKTLVYHIGRAPKGERTNWVMHEYRLVDMESEKSGILKDAYVLCRIFQKSGSGPKNGEQYGAPFVEEEWDDEELELVPENTVTENVDFDDDALLDYRDLQQILGSDTPTNNAPALVNFQPADSAHIESTESFHNMQTHPFSASNQHGEPELCDDVNEPDKEWIGECSKTGDLDDIDFFLDETFLDSSDIFQYTGEGFIEANDLSKPVEADPTASNDMLDEYLTFFDSNDDSSLYLTYDPLVTPWTENILSDEIFPHTEPSKGTEQAILPIQTDDKNADHNAPDAAAPSDKQTAKYQSDFELPYIKKASQILGNTRAPPAFAAENHSEETVRHLQSAFRSSSSYNVTSGVVQIRNLNMEGSLGKHSNFDILLCFGFTPGDGVLSGPDLNLPWKVSSAILRAWVYLIFICVICLYLNSKTGACIRAR
ncbi:NAC domain-containing protein 53-like [Andrographis paniculata]|uniref:NAC domain-containing protein 53-like n=1 Tax=Andrographis paniculata TaxID=175694 RepID=UPI0021E91EBE|nr:NAC domain-containing protein 53-like [Andrographis paniculata]